jgi:hypothetical protein
MMKDRWILLFLAFMAVSTPVSSATPKAPSRPVPPLTGHWQGVMTREDQDVQIELDFSQDAHVVPAPRYYCPMDREIHSNHAGKCPICGMELLQKDAGLHGTFTSLTQSVMDYPLDQLTFHQGSLHAAIGESILLDGKVDGDSLSGKFADGDAHGTFTMHRGAAVRPPYAAKAVTFSNGATTLSGTVLIPKGAGQYPAVVFIHGSGAQTRWGTQRFLADRFARAGIVALVYDKRGSGDSTGKLEASTYQDLAADAIAAVNLLRTLPQVDATRIGLQGHSEGGTVASIAASLAPKKIAFLIAADTIAGPVYQQDLYRTHLALIRSGFSGEQVAAADRLYALFVDVARGAKPREELKVAIAGAQHESWLNWLEIPGEDSWIWTIYPKRGNVNTLDFWQRIRAPVLLVYGERDQLVPVDESLARIEEALGPTATYAGFIIPNAQHNLTIQPESKGKFFWWRAAPGATQLMADWVLSTTMKSRSN